MGKKREDIINAAMKLFSEHGYQAVGVDQIKDAACVSKSTMYKYFATKENLIEAVLIRRDDLFCSDLNYEINQINGCMEKIKGVFEWHKKWFSSVDFHGCMFIKASEEFSDKNGKIRFISIKHKENIKNIFLNILNKYQVENSNELARYLLIILEGVIVNCNMFSNSECVESCWPFISETIERMKCGKRTAVGNSTQR